MKLNVIGSSCRTCGEGLTCARTASPNSNDHSSPAAPDCIGQTIVAVINHRSLSPQMLNKKALRRDSAIRVSPLVGSRSPIVGIPVPDEWRKAYIGKDSLGEGDIYYKVIKNKKYLLLFKSSLFCYSYLVII